MRQYVHAMIDIESLCNDPSGGVITEIGACIFSLDPRAELVKIHTIEPTMPSLRFFRRIIDIEDAVDNEKLRVEGATLKWWLDKERLQQFHDLIYATEPGVQVVEYQEALLDLKAWLGTACQYDWRNLQVWSHGSNYDLAIIGNHFRTAFDSKPPWPFRNENDTRTLFRLYVEKYGENADWGDPNPHKHNALADACHQARLVQRVVSRLTVADPEHYNVITGQLGSGGTR